MSGNIMHREGRSETEAEKEAVMGSSPKLTWSIQITCLLLNLTDPRSVAGNQDPGLQFEV